MSYIYMYIAACTCITCTINTVPVSSHSSLSVVSAEFCSRDHGDGGPSVSRTSIVGLWQGVILQYSLVCGMTGDSNLLE